MPTDGLNRIRFCGVILRCFQGSTVGTPVPESPKLLAFATYNTIIDGHNVSGIDANVINSYILSGCISPFISSNSLNEAVLMS